jgi:hypothetical protein
MGSARLTGCSPPKSLAIANAGVVILRGTMITRLRRLESSKSSSYDLAPILNGPIFLGAGPFFPHVGEYVHNRQGRRTR